MKYLIASISLLFGSLLFAQDSLIISSHRVLNDEFTVCKNSKNQLEFLDSLITRVINERPPSKGVNKEFYKRQNEKLAILNIDAGWISRHRGNFNLAHTYFYKSAGYLDTLKKYDLYDNYIQNTIGAYNNLQRELCYQTYKADTAIFYAWVLSH